MIRVGHGNTDRATTKLCSKISFFEPASGSWYDSCMEA